jgi:DNA (cytosine-5)-methyltransferase 1
MQDDLTYVSFFSGIGGIDLGLDRAGWTCRAQVEIDPYCRRVLEKHWPDVPKFGDIKELTGHELPRTTLVAGGFPCQPVSLAGGRRGAADERWLWPEFARLLGVLRPRLVLLENVPGLLAGGGMAEVLGDLAALGLDAEWDCIPAAAFGAPHLRYRVFIVANARCGELVPIRQGARGWDAGGGGLAADVAHDDEFGGSARDGQPWPQGFTVFGAQRPHVADPQDANGRRADGADDAGWGHPQAGGRRVPGDWAEYWRVEPNVGRVAHGVPSRVDRLRSLGNAVVPQVSEWIGRQMIAALDNAPGIRDSQTHREEQT